MGIFSTMNIASTGLTAQRLRMDVIANNIANANTTRTTDGEVFRRKRVILRPRNDNLEFRTRFLPQALWRGMGEGVRAIKIEEDRSPSRLVYDPTHPDAVITGSLKGYVKYPNVNIVTEMVDLISASRAYEANVTVIQNASQMYMRGLEIGSR
ncbi:MAG: flagellar basal body rod protein FlgC [Spirochaetes bacterium]|jgi:flagellar basal-body rod protein FlgC|nr:flagellar basal body rod protein FlgC [Spirochaetota bacterium]MCK5569023.1 flagellar basal body rod protein FlgC [Spirochaetota bacterium]